MLTLYIKSNANIKKAINKSSQELKANFTKVS